MSEVIQEKAIKGLSHLKEAILDVLYEEEQKVLVCM